MGDRMRRNKWYSMKAANRIPAVEMERKLDEIRRLQAHGKRDRRIEEGKLWTWMFENEKLLQESIARFPLEEVVQRLTSVLKSQDDEEHIPYSEYYRQFIIFKAFTTRKLFGDKAEKRPRYSDLYRKEGIARENNKRSIYQLFDKHNKDMKSIQALQILRTERQEESRPETHATYTSTGPRSLSVKPMQARPHHRRRNSKASRASTHDTTQDDQEKQHGEAEENDIDKDDSETAHDMLVEKNDPVRLTLPPISNHR